MEPVINYLAVLVSALATIVVGFLWYSPLLFGKLWMKLSMISNADIKKAKQKGMTASYLLMIISTLLMSYVLAVFLDYANALTPVAGLATGVLLWLGFVVPLLLGSVLWEGKSWKLYMLNVAYYLVVLIIMGAILGGWQ